MQNPLVRIALVGYLTDDMLEYIDHLNLDTRISKPLHLNDEQGKDFLPMFIEYMHRDSSVRASTKASFENHNNNIEPIMGELTDTSSVEELIKSYHNFYLDYVDSIKFIADGSCILVPYPLAGNRNVDFDYYIVLEQDLIQTFAEYSNKAHLFEMFRRRMEEVLPFIPQDRMTKITLPYKPYDKLDTTTRLVIVNHISSFCVKFFEDNYNKLASLEIDSNPQSSNSTF